MFILSKNKLAKWHNLKEKKLKKLRLKSLNFIQENEFLKNLFKMGYLKIKSSNVRTKKKLLYKSFQRRFRQSLINGIADHECLLISKNLLK